MAYSNSGFTLKPQGQLLTLTSVKENGANVAIYSDTALTSQVTLPVTVSADTTYYVDHSRSSSQLAAVVTFPNGAGAQTVSIPVIRGQLTPAGAVPTNAQLALGMSGPAAPGTATLVGGTVTVSDTNVTANTVVSVWHQAQAGTTGALYVSAKSVGASFTIKSTSGTDTSVVYYRVISY
jgi:hypothetical protein